MRLTVLGGAGGFPGAGGACSGYLIEHDGFRLLVDPGYAIVPKLLGMLPAEAIDAVLVSHGHPDHVADLNPLLRARALRDDPAPRLPAYAVPGALGPVLALDQIRALPGTCDVREFEPGDDFAVGPFAIQSRLLPHSIPNAAFRVSADGQSITYTGDAAPSDALVELADTTDILLAEATYVESVPSGNVGALNCAVEVGRQAAGAKALRLILTHLMPGTDPEASRIGAARAYHDEIEVATAGLVVDLTAWDLPAPSRVGRLGSPTPYPRIRSPRGSTRTSGPTTAPTRPSKTSMSSPSPSGVEAGRYA